MKLTKKNARRLKAIQKALASGKGLGGLLVGLAAATVATGCNRPPFATAGIPANFHNEHPDVFVTEGEVPELPEPPEPVATNAVNEAKGDVPVPLGEPAPPPQNLPPVPPGQYCVKPGDTLAAIAAKYGATITTLKQLNGFDDKRADRLKAEEIIKVPNTNAVNESRDRELTVKGMIIHLPPEQEK